MTILKHLYRTVLPHSVRAPLYAIRNPKSAIPKTNKRAKPSFKSNLKAAIKLRSAMDSDGALAAIYRALGERPQDIVAQQLLADIHVDAGNFPFAVGVSGQILKADPFNVRAIKRLRGMGVESEYALSALDKFDARSAMQEDFLPVLEFLFEAGEFSLMEQYATLALAQRSRVPDLELTATLHVQQATAIEFQGDHERAIAAFTNVAEGTKARLRGTPVIARCYLELGDIQNAEAAMNKLYGGGDIASIPYNTVLQAIFYKRGKIGDAHLIYRNRKTSNLVASYFGKARPVDFCLREAKGRLVLLSEGGPGDEIRFSTMYGQLAKQFDKVSVSASPRLTPLLRRSFPTVDFIECERYRNEFTPTDLSDRQGIKNRGLLYFINDAVAEAAITADHVASTLDALGELRAIPEDFLEEARLIPDPIALSRWMEGPRKKKRVALAWRSLLRSTSRDRHYLNVQDLEPLRALRDVEFWLAQPGATFEELDYLSSILDLKVPPNLDLKDDFDGQAAFLRSMDAVVAPLTVTAELAGAVGVPTIIFARTHIATWRQQPSGKDIWYPNAKLLASDPVWDKHALMGELVSEIARLSRTVM
jgi:tetratricopeptide (TPR) repeat protein